MYTGLATLAVNIDAPKHGGKEEEKNNKIYRYSPGIRQDFAGK
jgi:hypothetical protein